MDTPTAIQFWLGMCWLSAIVFVVLLTLFGGLFVVSDQEVVRVATNLKRTQRQFDLFITTMAGEPSDKSFEIDPRVLAELREAWNLIQEQAKQLGMTPEEFMRQVAKQLEQK